MATYEDFVLRMKVQGADDVKEVRGSIQNLKGDLESLGQVGGPLGNTINGIVGKFGALGLGAVAAAGALVGLGTRALQIAGDMSDISGATGIATGTLMNFRNSVIEAGGKAEDFGLIASKLNQSIQEAASGNEKFQRSFKDLGVFVTDASGAVRSTEDILRDITSQFNRGELSASQYAAAIDILGKGINRLELQKLTALKDPVADADIKRLDSYNEAIDRVRARLERGIVTFFGSVAEQAEKAFGAIDRYNKKLEDTEKQLNAVGRTSRAYTADPRLLMAPGSLGAPGGRPMTDAEKATLARQQEEQRMAALMSAYRPRPNEREAGGFGTKGEEQLKREKAELEKIQKELDQQLKTVTNIGNAYELSSQAAAEKLRLQMATTDMTEQERTMYEGVYEINRKANDAIVRLNEQRQGAQGETLKLINSEIAAVERQRDAELDVFMTNQKVLESRQQQQRELMMTVALMEQQAETARELAAYQQQIDRARMAAFDVVQPIREFLAITEQEQRLQLSIRNLRAQDQTTIRNIFDLEQQRFRVLQAISKIPDLPYEDRLEREKEINGLYDERRAAIEGILAQTKLEQESFVIGWDNALERWRNNLQTDAERAAQAFGIVTRGFEDSIVRFVQTGKLSFRSLFNDLIAQAVRASANRLLMSIFGGMFGGGGGGGGGFFGRLFGGFREDGGPVGAGKAYVVGEKGPEMFVPRQNGTIVPNNALAGGGGTQITNVNYSIQAVDASSFRSLVARDPEFLYNVTEQGRRQLPLRSRR